MIQFDAAPGSRPTVWIGTGPLAGSPGTYTILGQPVKLAVDGGTPNGTMSRYTAAGTGLPPNTQHRFIVTAYPTNNSRENQTTGEFRRGTRPWSFASRAWTL